MGLARLLFAAIAVYLFFSLELVGAQFSGLPAGLQQRQIAKLREPTGACTFSPPGRPNVTYAFITTQPGILYFYNGSVATRMVDLSKVPGRQFAYEGESGLLSCVADSSFVWLFYSIPGYHVVSRFAYSLKPLYLVLASEKRLVLLPRAQPYHTGGTLAWFVEAGRRSLLIGRGDDARCDYELIPECAAVLNNSEYRGKVLRVDPNTGLGLTTNPFYRPGLVNANASRVFITGLRNPWTVAQVPGTARVAVWDAGADHSEMLKILGKGEFGGWPCYEGTVPRLPQVCSAAKNRTISKRLAEYPHKDGNACIIGGAFLGNTWRASLRRRYIYNDYGSGWVWTGSVNGLGFPIDRRDLGRMWGIVRIVSGPGGRVWLMNYSDSSIWELWDGTPGAK